MINMNTQQAIGKYDLTEDFSEFHSVIMGEAYRHHGEWKFNIIGEGRKEDFIGLCAVYGIQ